MTEKPHSASSSPDEARHVAVSAIERLKAEAAQARTGEQLDDIKSRIDRELSLYRGVLKREQRRRFEPGMQVRIRDSVDRHPGEEGRVASITEDDPGEVRINVYVDSCTHTYSPEQLMPLEGLEHGNEESPEVRTYFTDLFDRMNQSEYIPSYGYNHAVKWNWALDEEKVLVDMILHDSVPPDFAERGALSVQRVDSTLVRGTGMEELIKAIGPGKRVKRSVSDGSDWYIELEDV